MENEQKTFFSKVLTESGEGMEILSKQLKAGVR